MARHRAQHKAVAGEDLRQWIRGVVDQGLNWFLVTPLFVVAGFIALTIGLYYADEAIWSASKDIPSQLIWLGKMFGQSSSLSKLLGKLLTGLLTITSITFSLLLLAVQQGGSSYSNQVFDQFLRRKSNQLYLGYFVGLTIFVLFTLVTANTEHRPVFGTVAAVVLTAVGLYLIIVLIYYTIVQSRPQSIINAIRFSVLQSRRRQLKLLRSTRRSVTDGMCVVRPVRLRQDGYVVAINVGRIVRGIETITNDPFHAPRRHRDIEIRFCAMIGDYVAYRDTVAEVRCVEGVLDASQFEALEKTVLVAVTVAKQRDLDRDPSLGLQQLATVGWTTISTSNSNPTPGTLVCRALRDIISRLMEDGTAPEDRNSPIIYEDVTLLRAVAVLETLMVVAHESLQHQSLAEILRTFRILLPDLPEAHVAQVADIVRRSLSTLGEHVLTRELQTELQSLSEALADHGHQETACAVTEAMNELRQSIGKLGSRSTRAQAAQGK